MLVTWLARLMGRNGCAVSIQPSHESICIISRETCGAPQQSLSRKRAWGEYERGACDSVPSLLQSWERLFQGSAQHNNYINIYFRIGQIGLEENAPKGQISAHNLIKAFILIRLMKDNYRTVHTQWHKQAFQLSSNCSFQLC